MTDGLVVVDKPAGMTSHGVVARVRKLAGTRKVGHAGTLDPMATGVLVLGIGKATRLLGHLLVTDKEYDATIRLGASTTTDDAEGDVLVERDISGVTESAVREQLATMVGEIAQVPSAVSAVKVDGKRAYQRVRDGEDVELAPRRVTIHQLDVSAIALPDIEVTVRCSSGTYIRAIARDVGEALDVGGHLTALRRTRVGLFDLQAASTLEQLADTFSIVSLAAAARAVFPHQIVGQAEAAAIAVGKPLDVPLEELTALFGPDGTFLALYRPRAGGGAVPQAVFAPA